MPKFRKWNRSKTFQFGKTVNWNTFFLFFILCTEPHFPIFSEKLFSKLLSVPRFSFNSWTGAFHLLFRISARPKQIFLFFTKRGTFGIFPPFQVERSSAPFFQPKFYNELKSIRRTKKLTRTVSFRNYTQPRRNMIFLRTKISFFTKISTVAFR